MPAQRRHPKLKAPSDFQRKKKKVGKGKQVPENVTKTTFKSKSVLVPCQLESSCGGPTNHRKQSIQVLLTHINHHNASVRHDALQGLREIVQSHPNLIPKNLPKLVEQVFSTIVDSSASVRHASHGLIQTLLSLVSNDVINPFFEILVAHLNCGLTHIKEKIQLDSLKVLGLFMQHCSNLLMHHVGSILPVLTGLLSRQESVSSHSCSVSKKGRKSLMGIIQRAGISGATLISNPSSNLLNSKSRLSIFRSIVTLLKLVLGPHTAENLENPANSEIGTFLDEGTFIKLTSTLVNIVLESWVEMQLTNVSVLPVHSLELMDTIVNMLCVLLKLALRLRDSVVKLEGELAMVDLCKTVSSDIHNHMLCCFPFKIPEKTQFRYTMNLSFCEVALLLQKLLGSAGVPIGGEKFTLPVLHYLGDLSSNDIKYMISSAQMLKCSESIIDITPLLCEVSCCQPGWQEAMLAGAFEFIRDLYLAFHPHARSKRMFVECFGKLFVRELASPQLSKSVVLDELLLPWCGTLLDLFLDLGGSSPATSSIVIDSIATAAVHKNNTIITELHQKLLPLLSSSTGFVSDLSELTQRRLVELTWHLPIMNEEDLTLLSKLVTCGEFDGRVKQYLVQIVHHKYMREDSILSSTPPYLSFMLTVLVGYQCNRNDHPDLEVTPVEKSSASSGQYIELQQTVSECLMATSISKHMLSCLEEALLKLKVSSLPVSSLCGILRLCCSFGPLGGHNVSTDLITWFSNVCLSSLLVGIDHTSSDHTQTEREILGVCTQLSYQIIGMSQTVVESMLQLFSTQISSLNQSDADIYVRLLVKLLSHPHLCPMLWKARDNVQSPLRDIIMDNISLVGNLPSQD